MDDQQLAEWINAPIEVARKIPADERKQLEAMASKYDEIMLFQAGLGPKPDGVILCGPKQVRGA